MRRRGCHFSAPARLGREPLARRSPGAPELTLRAVWVRDAGANTGIWRQSPVQLVLWILRVAVVQQLLPGSLMREGEGPPRHPE
jgi:hypothetical protein